jgi:hypothetical protein
MLYSVFLHELGHLQLVNERPRSPRLRFAHEKLAREFAMEWCERPSQQGSVNACVIKLWATEGPLRAAQDSGSTFQT